MHAEGEGSLRNTATMRHPARQPIQLFRQKVQYFPASDRQGRSVPADLSRVSPWRMGPVDYVPRRTCQVTEGCEISPLHLSRFHCRCSSRPEDAEPDPPTPAASA